MGSTLLSETRRVRGLGAGIGGALRECRLVGIIGGHDPDIGIVLRSGSVLRWLVKAVGLPSRPIQRALCVESPEVVSNFFGGDIENIEGGCRAVIG